jgi:hypothetical protein
MWLTIYSCPFAFVLANAIILASSRNWSSLKKHKSPVFLG